MLAGPVEAEGAGELDVTAERLVRGRRQQAVREIPLVQHQALDERLAVEPHATVAGLDGAEPEVALDTVDDPAVAITQRGLEVVQPGRRRVPGHHRFEHDPRASRGAFPGAGHQAVVARDRPRPRRRLRARSPGHRRRDLVGGEGG